MNAYPILKVSDDDFIVFQKYSLFEALYETPFYWMNEDLSYCDTALMHRGSFAESFCYDRLCRVFGEKRVFPNVKIRDHRGQDLGEIDILVKFSHIGIVLQAKSKRLTLEARKGNDGVLKSDFHKSIQSSYDQGLSCAQELIKRSHGWFDRNGNQIKFDTKFERVLILCVVSDHYSALAFQCGQFLKQTATETIPAPFVMDVFTLDIITEMLDTPLYFLDYVVKRTKYFDKISMSHELTALSYHLKHNLWLEDKYDYVHFADDFTSDLDVAIFVRRRGVPGKATPDGILTRIADKAIGRFIRQIETLEHRATTNLGLLLLSLSEGTLNDLSAAMEQLALQARQDAKGHDVTLWFESPSTGLTIHVNDDELHYARTRLASHCEMRKYKQRATQWFGVCLSPVDLAPRFGLEINYPWVHDEESERVYGSVQGAQPSRSLRAALRRKRRKLGRNEPCPCGSGLKYKRCRLN